MNQKILHTGTDWHKSKGCVSSTRKPIDPLLSMYEIPNSSILMIQNNQIHLGSKANLMWDGSTYSAILVLSSPISCVSNQPISCFMIDLNKPILCQKNASILAEIFWMIKSSREPSSKIFKHLKILIFKKATKQ